MAYSLDLRQRAIDYAKEHSPTEASVVFKIGRATINRWLKRKSLVPGKPGPVGPSKVNLAALKQAAEDNPDVYIDELAQHLQVSYSAVRTNLKRLKISRKKTMLYKERNEENRSKFQQEIKTIEPASIVYVDESGLEQTLCREYGRCLKGKRLMGEKTGKRTRRTSIRAGLCNGKPLAPFTGYCNTEVVLTWVNKVLLPVLKPGQTVIWDNASFHQSPQFKIAIESVGCQLKFLPAYSPDLNPIERYWAKLKSVIRRLRTVKMTLNQAICKAFKMAH